MPYPSRISKSKRNLNWLSRVLSERRRSYPLAQTHHIQEIRGFPSRRACKDRARRSIPLGQLAQSRQWLTSSMFAICRLRTWSASAPGSDYHHDKRHSSRRAWEIRSWLDCWNKKDSGQRKYTKHRTFFRGKKVCRRWLGKVFAYGLNPCTCQKE
jgi:hypothetical protein